LRNRVSHIYRSKATGRMIGIDLNDSFWEENITIATAKAIRTVGAKHSGE